MRHQKKALAFLSIAAIAIIMSSCNGGPAPGPPCTCYWSEDCPGGQDFACDRSTGCVNTGKLDGNCKGEIIIQGPELSSAEELFDLAFSAYEEPIRNGGGHPNAEIWAQIGEQAPSERMENAVKKITNNILDVTLGFDFGLTISTEPSGPGNIKLVTDQEAMLALLNASKQSVLLALQQNDLSAVREPLERFWSMFPDYQPAHTGRCYPHGHPEQEKLYDHPIDCQANEIEVQLIVFLGIGQ